MDLTGNEQRDATSIKTSGFLTIVKFTHSTTCRTNYIELISIYQNGNDHWQYHKQRNIFTENRDVAAGGARSMLARDLFRTSQICSVLTLALQGCQTLRGPSPTIAETLNIKSSGDTLIILKMRHLCKKVPGALKV